MKVYAGTSGFSYREWKGRFYPKDLPAGQMLRCYGGAFPAVEINGTFRRMPEPSALAAWAAEVPRGFKFVLKAPQRITHIRRLKDTGELVSSLFATASALKTRLGPVLFQLPPNLKKDVPRLTAFLSLLPADHRAAFEFRNDTWFDDDVYAALEAGPEEARSRSVPGRG